eukprot:TRINITY_DN3893_c0_g1_i1.p1 TRINITY_DN3893_c0_g1~~TRINITY_DN3893_c0_g1_i1.p1  ORF type:complete len:2795 (-),score=932.94 TRINITY_DN3893_c0_g1_i1:135-8519(-)
MKAILVIGILCAFYGVTHASHFRYGHMNWKQTSTAKNKVTITVDQTWRLSTTWFQRQCPGGVCKVGDTFNPGGKLYTNGGTPHFFNIKLKITSINTAMNYMTGTYTSGEVTYPDGAGEYYPETYTCCRISGIKNFPEEVKTTATIKFPAASTELRQSVVTSVPAIVAVQQNWDNQVTVSGVDGNNDRIEYRRVPVGNGGDSNIDHPIEGLKIDPDTGSVSWNPKNSPLGLYTVIVEMWDYDPNFCFTETKITNCGPNRVNHRLSRTMVDFFFEVVPRVAQCDPSCANSGVTCVLENPTSPCGSCATPGNGCVGNEPPVFVSPTPADQTTIIATPGNPVTFTVKATDSFTVDTVFIQSVFTTPGMTLTNQAGPTGEKTADFTWTPGNDPGNYQACFFAIDNHKAQTDVRCVNIKVGVLSLASLNPTEGPQTGGTLIEVNGVNFALPGQTPPASNFLCKFRTAGGPGVNVPATFVSAEKLTCTTPKVLEASIVDVDISIDGGFRWTTDHLKFTFTNVDECTTGTHDCVSGTTCVDTNSGFQCRCNQASDCGSGTLCAPNECVFDGQSNGGIGYCRSVGEMASATSVTDETGTYSAKFTNPGTELGNSALWTFAAGSGRVIYDKNEFEGRANITGVLESGANKINVNLFFKGTAGNSGTGRGVLGGDARYYDFVSGVMTTSGGVSLELQADASVLSPAMQIATGGNEIDASALGASAAIQYRVPGGTFAALKLQLKVESCDDIDECAGEGPNLCDAQAICTNTLGSYTCTCKAGFTGDGFDCVDIDECAAASSPCPSHATCTNVWGSFNCECQTGFFGDGTFCTNGCIDNNIQCPEAGQLCRALPPPAGSQVSGHECINGNCPPGSREQDGKCIDIDECAEGTHDCVPNKARCTNTIGGFTCQCNTVFYAGDGHIASSRRRILNFEKLQTAGTGCNCPSPGYVTRYRNQTEFCQDINECYAAADLPRLCEDNAFCENTVGGFSCTCKPGFSGEGQWTPPKTDGTCHPVAPENGCHPCADCAASQTCQCKAGYGDLQNLGLDCVVNNPGPVPTCSGQFRPGVQCSAQPPQIEGDVTLTVEQCSSYPTAGTWNAVTDSRGGLAFTGTGNGASFIFHPIQLSEVSPVTLDITRDASGDSDVTQAQKFTINGHVSATDLTPKVTTIVVNMQGGGVFSSSETVYLGAESTIIVEFDGTGGGSTKLWLKDVVLKAESSLPPVCQIAPCSFPTLCPPPPGGCGCDPFDPFCRRKLLEVHDHSITPHRSLAAYLEAQSSGAFKYGIMQTSTPGCADIRVNECDADPNPCASDPTRQCIEKDDGYECACKDGYKEIGNTCEDIDECLIGTHDCGTGRYAAMCRNTDGGFECACQIFGPPQAVHGTPCPGCGNGKLELVIGGGIEGEECDDGNENDLDGCDGQCRVEDGWSCIPSKNNPGNMGKAVCTEVTPPPASFPPFFDIGPNTPYSIAGEATQTLTFKVQASDGNAEDTVFMDMACTTSYTPPATGQGPPLNYAAKPEHGDGNHDTTRPPLETCGVICRNRRMRIRAFTEPKPEVETQSSSSAEHILSVTDTREKVGISQIALPPKCMDPNGCVAPPPDFSTPPPITPVCSLQGRRRLRTAQNNGVYLETAYCDDSHLEGAAGFNQALTDDPDVQISTLIPGYSGDSYWYTNVPGAAMTCNIQHPEPLGTTYPGLYKVELRWTSSSSRNTDVVVEVRHSNGEVQKTTVNQRVGGSQWQNIGVYRFDGNGASVTVRNTMLDCYPMCNGTCEEQCSMGTGFTIVDAFQFIPLRAGCEGAIVYDNAQAGLTGSWKSHSSSTSANGEISHSGPGYLVSRPIGASSATIETLVPVSGDHDDSFDEIVYPPQPDGSPALGSGKPGRYLVQVTNPGAPSGVAFASNVPVDVNWNGAQGPYTSYVDMSAGDNTHTLGEFNINSDSSVTFRTPTGAEAELDGSIAVDRVVLIPVTPSSSQKDPITPHTFCTTNLGNGKCVTKFGYTNPNPYAFGIRTGQGMSGDNLNPYPDGTGNILLLRNTANGQEMPYVQQPQTVLFAPGDHSTDDLFSIEWDCAPGIDLVWAISNQVGTYDNMREAVSNAADTSSQCTNAGATLHQNRECESTGMKLVHTSGDNPAIYTFEWTPVAEQQGSHTVCFSARDYADPLGSGNNAHHCTNITVFASCPNDCSLQGSCRWDPVATAMKCQCNRNYGGEDCSIRTGTSCISTGDPHFKNFDGRRFNFYGVGEFVLHKTPGFEVQARHITTARWAHMSVNKAMSVKISDDTTVQVENFETGEVVKVTAPAGSRIVTQQDSPEGIINTNEIVSTGAAVTMPVKTNFVLYPSGVQVRYTNGPTGRAGFQYIVQAADGRSALACLWGKEYLNLAVRLTHPYKDASMEGLCGTWNDDRRDDLVDPSGHMAGQVVNLLEDEKDAPSTNGEAALIASSMVNSETSAFTYAPGEGPETYNDPNFKGFYGTILMPLALKDEAIKKCAGLSETDRAACLNDIAGTNDIDMGDGVITGEALEDENNMENLPCAVHDNVITNAISFKTNGDNSIQYAVIDNAAPTAEDAAGCSASTTIPTGWRLAANNEVTRTVIATNKWSTSCVVLADGTALRQDGTICGHNQLLKVGYKQMCVAPRSCDGTTGYRVLIERGSYGEAVVDASNGDKKCKTMLCMGVVDKTWQEVAIVGAGVLAFVVAIAAVGLVIHRRKRRAMVLAARQNDEQDGFIADIMLELDHALENPSTDLSEVSIDASEDGTVNEGDIEVQNASDEEGRRNSHELRREHSLTRGGTETNIFGSFTSVFGGN